MVNPLLYQITGLQVLVAAIFAALIYWKLHTQEKTAMASFQLKKDQNIRDFEIYILSIIIMLPGGFLYAAGSYLDIPVLESAGYSFGIPFAAGVDYLLIQWWRRF